MANLEPSRLCQSTPERFLVDAASHESSGARLGLILDFFQEKKSEIRSRDFFCNNFLNQSAGCTPSLTTWPNTEDVQCG